MGQDGDDLGKDLDKFVVHGQRPQTLEAPRERLATAVTPTEQLFVRNILPAPTASDLGLDDRDAWRVEVSGVARPGTVTLGELRRLGQVEVTTVLQCSGNSRALFEHGPDGVPWGPGAVANATFVGVPVAAVVESRGGVADGARFLTATGGEPIGADEDERATVIERSIPADKALRDCLLAWELNGEPLPRAHGAPLRLIVPGYYAVNHVKYVARLAFAPHESDAALQAHDYRIRPIGVAARPDQPSMWEMAVKSMVTTPAAGATVPAGRLTIEGVAFGGESPVERVEVSLDGGAAWADARFAGADLGPTAWRLWSFEAEVGPGRLEIASRAHDREGRSQPEHREENAAGYGHNGWRDHLVAVDVA